MTAAGWIFMAISWGAIIGLFVFCIIRTLQSDKPKNRDK
jgi:hypothetical protein